MTGIFSVQLRSHAMERIPKYESAQTVDHGEENSPAGAGSERDSNPRLFDHESGVLTSELSAIPTKCHRSLLKKILLVLWKLIVIHGFE